MRLTHPFPSDVDASGVYLRKCVWPGDSDRPNDASARDMTSWLIERYLQNLQKPPPHPQPPPLPKQDPETS
ncbi:hypothetical protein MATL_G00062230 [Megalops atlanticus]|uniref:Uncharacterized protein n=1 Tax=Megalops atlanticus TaxID=7932 RepID=A0A9D3Q767_MEGAT|nr:hypothetical protein MATL_G00062230 [Megalops atlanticus]